MNLHLFNPLLVSQGNLSIVQSECQQLSIDRPTGAQYFALHLGFIHILILRTPYPEVLAGPADQHLGDGVVSETLDGVVVIVLENAFRLEGPNYDRPVLAAARKSFSIE